MESRAQATPIYDTGENPPLVVRLSRVVASLHEYRSLLGNLVKSDLRARFRRSQFGILWAFLQPLAFALTLALVWGAVRHTGDYWDFALYVFAGQVVFEFISNTITNGLDAFARSAGLLKQSRIPLIIFQARVTLTSGALLLCASGGVMIFAIAIEGTRLLGAQLLLVPFFFPILVLFALPLAIVMSFLGALYRDLKHISAIGLHAMFLLSPVMMPREFLEAPHLRFLEVINPVVPLIDMFRAPIIYGQVWDPMDLVVIGIWTVVLWSAAAVLSLSVGRRVVFSV